MKRNLVYVKKYLPWLGILALADMSFGLMLWLADVQAFYALAGVFASGMGLLFLMLCMLLIRRAHRQEKLFELFLETPDEQNEERLMRYLSSADRRSVHRLGNVLRENQNAYRQLLAREDDYEEYVERWAHEIKTPISLLALLLDNRREEMTETVALKLDYTRNRIQEYVNQMLYYARLKETQADYLFELIFMEECVAEVLEDYRPLLEEKRFTVEIELSEQFVYTDRRGLIFIISQVISNAVKYAGEKQSPGIQIRSLKEAGEIVLSIRDNGIGIRSMDLPYVWEKGVTGNSGTGRNKATGMGLYLAKGIAGHLHISLALASKWGEGTEMRLQFPEVPEVKLQEQFYT